jgi:chitinase
VGYFIAWGLYARNYHAKNVHTSGSAAILTHINYAFGNVKSSRCVVGDPWADYEKTYDAAASVDGVADQWNDPLRGNFNQLKKLKAQHPHLKILISLGGWTWSGGFSEAARPENRVAFVESCIDIFIRGNLPKSGDAGGPGSAAGLFDGIDVDWEYPAACGLQCGDPADTPNFTGLMAEFRKRLDAERPGLLLTIAAPGGEDKYSKIELAKVHADLDFINLMNYDYHGAWEQTTNFHSPLYGSSTDPSQGIVKTYFTDHTVQGYLDAGIPAGKLVIGLGFYGRGWANVPNADDGLYQASTTPAPGTYEAGIEDFKVLVTREPSFAKHRHPEAQAMWIFDGSTFWSYDDPESIRNKMAYAKSLGLGGAMFWELSGDTAGGDLIKAIRDGLGADDAGAGRGALPAHVVEGLRATPAHDDPRALPATDRGARREGERCR